MKKTLLIGLICLVTALLWLAGEQIPAPDRPVTSQPRFKPAVAWRASLNPKDRTFSTLQGRQVCLMPSNICFSITEDWLEWHERVKPRPSFYLTADAIEKAVTWVGGVGEFASVCNCIFPCDRCAFYGACYGLSLRVYDLEEPAEVVAKEIEEKGKAEFLRINGEKCFVGKGQHGEWNRVSFQFYWNDGECLEGLPDVDFFSRRVQNKTLIFCFMYQSPREPREATALEMLRSVELPKR